MSEAGRDASQTATGPERVKNIRDEEQSTNIAHEYSSEILSVYISRSFRESFREAQNPHEKRGVFREIFFRESRKTKKYS